MAEIANYLLLGLLQGIFEWLPISSEGIVALCSQFLISDHQPVDIALFLHLGTIFAVLIYFREDWKNVFTLKDLKMIRFLIVSSSVSLSLGYFLYHNIRESAVGNGLLLIKCSHSSINRIFC